jgi:O-antigen/teichoic acid export membrane protein
MPTFLAQSGEKILIPKIFGMEAMALFAIAFSLVEIPTSLLQKIAGSVLFPVYSEVVRANNYAAIPIALKKFLLYSLPIFMIPLLMLFLGTFLIEIMYDPRYYGAGSILAIMSIGAYFRMMRFSQEGMFLATGRTKHHMIVSATRLVTWVPASMFLGKHWGIEGFCVGIVIADAAALGAQRYLARRFIPNSSGSDLPYLLPLLASILAWTLFL